MRYDREFLVPYLRDICTLYYAEDRLKKAIEKCNESKKWIDQCGIVVQKPVYEEGKDWGLFVILMLTAIITSALLITGFFLGDSEGAVMIVACVLLFIAELGVLCRLGSKLSAEDKAIHRRNEAKREAFQNRWDMAVAKRQDEITRIAQRKGKIEKETCKIMELREKAYAANVIPGKYRDKYAMVYLYDLFSTSELDNLEWALQMYVLEEIKSKLDAIICNQSQMLLNQRIMIANQNMMMHKQDELLEQQERNSAEVMRKLDNIATSNEKRNIYLAMLGANSAVDAYFSSSDFFCV